MYLLLMPREAGRSRFPCRYLNGTNLRETREALGKICELTSRVVLVPAWGGMFRPFTSSCYVGGLNVSPITPGDFMLLAGASFFSRTGLANWGFRWLHILVGIMWIGLLYYFNFVQVPAFAEYDAVDGGPKARNVALDKVARRALWWFRWAAVLTFVTGILIAVLTEGYFSKENQNNGFTAIAMGMLLGTIMMLNVWGVIWRNQKVVLANAATVLGGGAANPDAPAAGRKALMASRQNAVFSVSMLFFMVFKSHSPYAAEQASNKALFWIIGLIIVAVMELNALGFMPWKVAPKKGLNMMYDNVRNLLISAFGLWAIFLILSEAFLNN